MEIRNHKKNGATPKSHMSRKEENRYMKKMILLLTVQMSFLICVHAQTISGKVDKEVQFDLINPKINSIELVKDFKSDTMTFDADIIVSESIKINKEGIEKYEVLAKGKLYWSFNFEGSMQNIVGLPNTRINISAIKQGLHYDDKIWYPTTAENCYIICLKNKIIGSNVRYEKEKVSQRK